jgi:hypothetical protein
LAELPAIRSLHATKTGLSERSVSLPGSITHAAIRATETARSKDLRLEGVVCEDHPDMPFFYK